MFNKNQTVGKLLTLYEGVWQGLFINLVECDIRAIKGFILFIKHFSKDGYTVLKNKNALQSKMCLMGK